MPTPYKHLEDGSLRDEALAGGRFVCGVSDEAMRLMPKVLAAAPALPTARAVSMLALRTEGGAARSRAEREEWDRILEARR